MAARQVIEVVKCRVADLKIGDVIRDRRSVNGGWFPVEKLEELPGGAPGMVFIQRCRGAGFSREAWDLVDLQLTRMAHNNAPHLIDVHLPDDGSDASASAVLPWDDEDGEIEVTIYRSPIDGAAVVEIDTTFEPYGADYDPSGEPPSDNIRINLNDGKIWDNGLWDGRNEQLVPDPR